MNVTVCLRSYCLAVKKTFQPHLTMADEEECIGPFRIHDFSTSHRLVFSVETPSQQARYVASSALSPSSKEESKLKHWSSSTSLVVGFSLLALLSEKIRAALRLAIVASILRGVRSSRIRRWMDLAICDPLWEKVQLYAWVFSLPTCRRDYLLCWHNSLVLGSPYYAQN